jgi:hypothetical protein
MESITKLKFLNCSLFLFSLILSCSSESTEELIIDDSFYLSNIH